MESNSFEVVIIGGGVVGLTVAYQLIERKITKNILIIEKESKLGLHTSGRNSGVLHAGIYYKPKSLKAKVCISGAKRLKSWIHERSLTINRCGKVIIPTSINLDNQLDILLQRGRMNGAEVELINKDKLKLLAPDVESASNRGLWSPTTSVVKPIEIINQLEKEICEKGVTIIKNSQITDINLNKKKIFFEDNSYTSYKYFFNCAGLQSDRIAQLCNLAKRFTILPFKGLYWKIKDTKKYNIKTNVYPVPDLSVPFLGVHFTPSADKIPKISIGPTATFAWGRENYKLANKIEPRMSIANLFILSKQYILNKNKFRKYVHEQSLQSFQPFLYKAAKELVPSLKKEDIEISDKVGIRAQLFDKKKLELVDDFICVNHCSSTHVLNAVSPAFTSSFALADLIINYSLLKKR